LPDFPEPAVFHPLAKPIGCGSANTIHNAQYQHHRIKLARQTGFDYFYGLSETS
jgi:hypothetical protein